MIKCKYYVYLLKSDVSNKTYIGYTTDPYRRLLQHNGIKSGGAKHTRKDRPWSLIMFITGFPTERTALQYEFCIQHTKKYRRTSGVKNKMYIMKKLLQQDKICKTCSYNNSELHLIFIFMNETYYDLWNKV